MESLPLTHKIAAALMVLYGLLSLVGGIMGYAKANSVASLAAGVPTGILLILCAWGVFQKPQWALAGAIIVCLPVLGFFGSKVFQNMNDLGGFLQSSAGPRTLAMVIGGLLVVLACAVALVASTPGPAASA